METPVIAPLLPDELAELDRVCRDHGMSRPDAAAAAIRWYIGVDGDLPPIDDPAGDEIDHE
jgi:hypothetical protein